MAEEREDLNGSSVFRSYLWKICVTAEMNEIFFQDLFCVLESQCYREAESSSSLLPKRPRPNPGALDFFQVSPWTRVLLSSVAFASILVGSWVANGATGM